MDTKEFLKQYEARKRSFAWVNLENANLQAANIPNLNFARANLQRANLEAANLSQSNLTKANFQGANLKAANLSNCQLYKGDFTDANLEGANLSNADITSVNWHNSSLTGAIMPNGLIYEDWLNNQDSLKQELETDITNNQKEILSLLSSLDYSFTSQPETTATSNQQIIRQKPPEIANLSHLKITNKQFYQHLPRPPLLLLGLGYICIGVILGLAQTNFLIWLLVIAISLVWLINENLVWYLPMLTTLTAVLALGLPLFIFILVGVATLIFSSASFVFAGFKKTLINLPWIVGLITIIMTCLALLVADTSFLPLKIILFLILAFVCLSLGAISYLPMFLAGYSKKQVIKTYLGITIPSLCLGLLIGSTGL